MDMPRDFLLDTNIVLHYARESDVYVAIESRFQLKASAFSPLVCVVTLGEIRAMAYRRKWGASRLQKLDEFLSHLVAISISAPAVIDAYARIQAAAMTGGWGIHNKKHDLWIAAVSHVLGATLLTTDGDFDPLHGVFIQRILFDAKTGAIIP